MVWKPKAKPLSGPEAIVAAKAELAKFWRGSEPLLAGVESEGKVALLPLDPSFQIRNFLFLIVDPTDFKGRSALSYLQEWQSRFAVHGIETVLVIYPTYGFLNSFESLDSVLKLSQAGFIQVLDVDRMISLGFEAKTLPKVVFLGGGKTLFSHAGENWHQNTELEIHRFLRQKDPGLALSPIFSADSSISGLMARDVGRIEFSELENFPKPGFTKSADGHWIARFSAGQFPVKLGAFNLEGAWVHQGEQIITGDPRAALQIRSAGSRFALICRPIKGQAEIIFELNGRPAYEGVNDQDLRFSDDGRSILKIREPGIYRVFANLPGEAREITLRFPGADQNPVGLVAARFGD